MTKPKEPRSGDDTQTGTHFATTEAKARETVSALDFVAQPNEKRYDVLKTIGRGGMGEVHLCRDRHLGRTVAMKVMRPDRVVPEESYQRFLREVRVQGGLEHPSIVPVYDLALNSEGEPFFTMRRLDGHTLQDALGELAHVSEAELRSGQRRLLHTFCQVCLAVDFAHSRGVIHRDLKPANIMVGGFGEVMVLDWGVARYDVDEEIARELDGNDDEDSDDLTQAGLVMGSPPYMSPEQVRGEPAGVRADVYALGAMLFEILTLERLHTGGMKARHRPPPLSVAERFDASRREVPPELADACARASAEEKADRTPSARLLNDAVQRFLDGERDGELREDIAEAHARAAETAGLGDEDSTRAAMKEVGRALALNPDNARARALLNRFFTAPLDSRPRALDDQRREARDGRLRYAARIGSVGFPTIFFYLPLLLWMGVRNALFVGTLYATVLVASALSAYVGFRRAAPSKSLIYAVLATSMLLVFGTSFIFGGLVIVPPFAAGVTLAWALVIDRRHRPLVITLGILTTVAPFALELIGALPPSFVFVDGTLALVPRTVALPPALTLTLIMVTVAATVAFNAIAAGRLGDALNDAEQRLRAQTWKLGQLAPAVDDAGSVDLTSSPPAPETPPAQAGGASHPER